MDSGIISTATDPADANDTPLGRFDNRTRRTSGQQTEGRRTQRPARRTLRATTTRRARPDSLPRHRRSYLERHSRSSRKETERNETASAGRQQAGNGTGGTDGTTEGPNGSPQEPASLISEDGDKRGPERGEGRLTLRALAGARIKIRAKHTQPKRRHRHEPRTKNLNAYTRPPARQPRGRP